MAKKIADPYSQEAKYGAVFGETDRNMEKKYGGDYGGDPDSLGSICCAINKNRNFVFFFSSECIF